MPKFTVKYTSVGGPLTGLAVGAEVTLGDPEEIAHLTGLGLIEPLTESGPEGGGDAPGDGAKRKPAKR